MFKKIIQTDDDCAALVLRLALGIMMFPHGAQKMLGWFGGGGFSGTMQFFSQNMGMPAVLAFLVIIIEFFGSIGLTVGFLSRIAALGVSVVMLGAVVTVHAANGFFMNWLGNQEGEGFEFHILAIGIAIAVMLKGGGAFSVDRKLSA